MANRVENAKPAATAEKPAPAAEAPAAPAAGGGMKSMLPLMANLLLMPVLAYAMTTFVLVPKLAGKNASAGQSSAEDGAAKADEGGHGGKKADAKADESHGKSEGAAKDHGGGKAKQAVPLSKKTLVNVAGTMGTRYLVAEFTLVGQSSTLKEKVEKADAELRDAAASTLSSKTISDLEKPGVRNLVRTELMSVFNSILGKGSVTEIYLTEFAIQ